MSDDLRSLFADLRTGGGRPISGPTLQEVVTDDPEVEGRWMSRDPEGPTQVVTAYPPRSESPAAYPPELPFVPGVRVWISDMEDRPGRPAARLIVEGAADVLAAVRTAIEREGWRREPAREFGFPFPGRRVVMRRESQARLLLEASLEDGRRVVQLLDLV